MSYTTKSSEENTQKDMYRDNREYIDESVLHILCRKYKQADGNVNAFYCKEFSEFSHISVRSKLKCIKKL